MNKTWRPLAWSAPSVLQREMAPAWHTQRATIGLAVRDVPARLGTRAASVAGQRAGGATTKDSRHWLPRAANAGCLPSRSGRGSIARRQGRTYCAVAVLLQASAGACSLLVCGKPSLVDCPSGTRTHDDAQDMTCALVRADAQRTHERQIHGRCTCRTVSPAYSATAAPCRHATQVWRGRRFECILRVRVCQSTPLSTTD